MSIEVLMLILLIMLITLIMLNYDNYVDLCWIMLNLMKNIGFMMCFGELLKIGFRMIGFILCFGGKRKVIVILYCVFEAPIRPDCYLQWSRGVLAASRRISTQQRVIYS